MILAFVCCLFVFLGMVISDKYDFKKLSINALFGLFTMNVITCVALFVYKVLFRNYHSSTFFYVFLSTLLGYLLVKLINCKYDDCDNVSILGFTIVNTYLFIFHSFNILFLLINIIYYILLGIYIKKSKSWIFVLIGALLGIVFSFIDNWVMGYIYGINLGFIFYYVISVYGIVFRSKDRNSYIGLIVGFVIALLGGLL